jgi:hypothetical protein
MTQQPSSDFRQIVTGYLEAASILNLTREDVEMAVRKATRFTHSCTSCRFSRAPFNCTEIAIVEGRLPIHTRRCTRAPPARKCRHWEPLDLPVEILP